MGNFNYFIKRCYYNFLAELQYKTNLFISLISVLFDLLANVIVFYLIIYNFNQIGGFNFIELLFMYSIFLSSHGLVLMVSRSLWNISNYIVKGKIDEFCIRPRNILIQLLCNSFLIGGSFYFFGGLMILIYTDLYLFSNLNIIKILQFLIIIISGAVIELSLLLFFVALSFRFVNLSTLIYLNVDIMNGFLGFPMTIYNGFLRLVFTFIYPIGFMSFYPSLFFLSDRQSNLSWFLLTPIVSAVLFAISCLSFKLFLKNYQSAGG